MLRHQEQASLLNNTSQDQPNLPALRPKRRKNHTELEDYGELFNLLVGGDDQNYRQKLSLRSRIIKKDRIIHRKFVKMGVEALTPGKQEKDSQLPMNTNCDSLKFEESPRSNQQSQHSEQQLFIKHHKQSQQQQHSFKIKKYNKKTQKRQQKNIRQISVFPLGFKLKDQMSFTIFNSIEDYFF